MKYNLVSNLNKENKSEQIISEQKDNNFLDETTLGNKNKNSNEETPKQETYSKGTYSLENKNLHEVQAQNLNPQGNNHVDPKNNDFNSHANFLKNSDENGHSNNQTGKTREINKDQETFDQVKVDDFYIKENPSNLNKNEGENNNPLKIKKENNNYNNENLISEIQNGNILDDLLLDEKEEKKRKNKNKSKKEKKEKVTTDEEFEQVIDLEEVKKKEKVENSDIILSLIEVCQNASKYGLTSSNKSRLFWDELFKKEEISRVFNNFKSETLRKYWRLISELDKNQKVIEKTRQFADLINKENVK